MRHLTVLAAIGVILAGTASAHASIVTFDDETAFLDATAASEIADFHTTASGNRGLGPITVGSASFTSASGDLWVLDWSTHLDDEELAISDVEDLDVSIQLGGEVFSFGFQFVEPEFDPKVNGVYMDSTFTVTLLSGATTVDSFAFNAPNDQAAFVGVWSSSDQGFDNVEIRETVGANGNEFFGEFYAGTQPIPEPASVVVWSLLGMGWAGVCVWRRRRGKLGD